MNICAGRVGCIDRIHNLGKRQGSLINVLWVSSIGWIQFCSDREQTRQWYEKVLGAEFLDRGPELNARQLQLKIGSGEIHTTDTPNPTPSGHFAVEIHDWEFGGRR